MILRYLKGTANKGLIVDFTGWLTLDAYCDADQAGLFNREHPRDPDSARSRGGYVIFLGGMPLIWKSSLLKCITVSTLESEYVQLSLTMTVLLGIKYMVEELTRTLPLRNLRSTIRTTIFEDNNGALLLATEQRITPRTRYLHVRWHHFWSEISENNDGKDGKVVAKKVDTKKQRADFLTKGLPCDPFVTNRKRVNGW